MGDESVLDELIRIAQKLGLELKFENLYDEDINTRSGSCRVDDKNVLIIDSRLATAGKISVLLCELSKHDAEHLYISPRVRDLLEKRKK
jgi:uracil phosphoribosyltransferase